jgi:hypothetical protein
VDQNFLRAEAIEINEQEVGYLGIVASLVSSSPRRAKRFLNIYRVAKARVMTDPEVHGELSVDGARPYDIAPLLFLIALVVGLPDIIPQALDNYEAGDHETLRIWLSEQIRGLLGDSSDSRRLDGFLANAGALSEIPMSEIIRWVPIAKRFAWPVTEHLPHTKVP